MGAALGAPGLLVLAAKYGLLTSEELARSGWEVGASVGEAGMASQQRATTTVAEANRLLGTLPKCIDVTEQLQFFVHNSELDLVALSKASLLGFYDPTRGVRHRGKVRPQLFVRYSFAGHVFELLAEDWEPVHLPSSKAVLVGDTEMPVDWTVV